jgi:hypothetical protein
LDGVMSDCEVFLASVIRDDGITRSDCTTAFGGVVFIETYDIDGAGGLYIVE